MQPGSSIMPGKVNPVIPEAVNQVCFQVIGNDLVVTMAAEAGQLQLNAFEPVMGYNLLTSLTLLARAAVMLAEKCVVGIEADRARCRAGAEASIALATALNPLLGYEASAKIAKAALASGRSVRDVAIEHGVAPDVADRVLDPLAMARS
jgi:aspartate ammonia-lyase